jgi:hypothetical protein
MIWLCEESPHLLTWQEVADDAVIGLSIVLGILVIAFFLYKVSHDSL